MTFDLRKQLALAACAVALACTAKADAQALPTATGPGSFVSLGVAASGFQQNYGSHYIGGETAYVDANLLRRIGIEAEVRLLNAHTTEDIKESTYLVGPRFAVSTHGLRPYVKFLVGRGTVFLPFHYGSSSDFVMAPGAGIDWHFAHRLTFRIVDAEYQIWPRFAYPVSFYGASGFSSEIAYAQLHPYGISTGISFDLFTPSSTLRGRHF